MNDFEIYKKLVSLPEDLKKEADDFVDFLKAKVDSDYQKTSKKSGLAKGLIKMKEGFDEPLEDFKDYME